MTEEQFSSQSIFLIIKRGNGTEQRAEPKTLPLCIARLGIDSVQGEATVNGESIGIRFEFDPPLAPREEPE